MSIFNKQTRAVFSWSLFTLFCFNANSQQINIDTRKNLKYDAERSLQVLNLGKITKEEIVNGHIYIKPDAKLIIEQINVIGEFKLTSPSTNYNPGSNSTIDIQFDSRCKVGDYLGEVEIVTNGPMKKRVIGLKATVIEKTSQFELDMDTLKCILKDKLPLQFEIKNTGSSTLKIAEIKTNDPTITFQFLESMISPDKKLVVSVNDQKLNRSNSSVMISIDLVPCENESLILHQNLPIIFID